MFDLWAEEFRMPLRGAVCVFIGWTNGVYPAEDSESNYGNTRGCCWMKWEYLRSIFFPIDGSNVPDDEANSYSRIVRCNAPLWHGFPPLDIVLLGAGEDGHTSSIFPGQEYLLSSFHPYEVSVKSLQWAEAHSHDRVVCFFNAKQLIFFVTGRNKSNVVRDILIRVIPVRLPMWRTMPGMWKCLWMSWRNPNPPMRVIYKKESDLSSIDVPLSRMLTMENSVKQMPPNPANTRAGTK